jgi:hypothetical protein
MIIEMKGKSLLVTGDVEGWTRAQIEAAAERWGGTLAAGPSKKVDLFAAGDKPSAGKIAKARSLGIRELPVKKLLLLLRFGAVEIKEEAPAPVVPLHDAIGELRALADGAPDAARWAALVAQADKADPDRKEALIHYIDAQVARWEPSERLRWLSTMLAVRHGEGTLCGDLRVMPVAWVQEILRGEHDPKHALARALSLDGTKANATMAAALFDSPHLSALRALDLGSDLKLAKGFYKRLVAHEGFPALDALVCYPRDAGAAAALAGEGFPALRHLHLRSSRVHAQTEEVVAALEALFTAPWMARIETIEASIYHHGDLDTPYQYGPHTTVYTLITQHLGRLPALKRLIISNAYLLGPLLDSPVLDQIEELIITGSWSNPVEGMTALQRLLARLRGRRTTSLKRLDLSQQVTWEYKLIAHPSYPPLPLDALRELSKKIPQIVLGPDGPAW